MSADTLSFRLEVLESGIRDVQTVLKAAREIPRALREARNGAESAKWFIEDIDQRLARERILSAIGAVKGFLEKIERHQTVLDYCDRQRITVETTRWIEALSSVGNALRECGAKGLTLTQQLEELVNKLSPLARPGVFDQNFQDRVSSKIDELTDEIQDMRYSLRRRNSSMDDLWGSYFTSIEPKAQRLFVDYLDLLGGVSIRERAPSSSWC